MAEIAYLKDLVVVLAASVLVVAVLRRLGVPPIAGFILTGVLAGPAALGLVDSTHEVEVLAEVGIVLLLFGIGMELSVERLRRLWKPVLVGGGLQVALAVAGAAGVCVFFGLEPGSAVFVGFVVAVSSTAVVLRGLAARGELEAPHGQLALGILVFQDLCVVPMILALPFLAGEGGPPQEVAWAVGKTLLILGGVLLAAGALVPRLLALAAGTRERELFVLTVFLVCLGVTWALSAAGISLALGAFLAGLIVGGSEFRRHATAEVIPARDVLACLFFVSVGMLLDVGAASAQLPVTLGMLGAILAGKFLIVLAAARVLRLPLRVGILSAAALCQIGEFSFVLLNAASGSGLLEENLSQNLLVAIILSMLLTPVVLAAGPRLALRAARVPWLDRLLGAQPPGVDAREPHRDHVVIAGYGLAGREISRALREAGCRYLVLDIRAENVRAANAAGDRAVLADVTRKEVLDEIGCEHARLVVLAVNDPGATELAIRTIRTLAPGIPILARTQYELDRPSLHAAGATSVVTGEGAASAVLVTACLAALSADRYT